LFFEEDFKAFDFIGLCADPYPDAGIMMDTKMPQEIAAIV
jgi:hypothetical protein